MRYNRGFEDLDESFSGSSSPGSIGSGADLADAGSTKVADAKDVSDGGKTAPIVDPEPRKYRTGTRHTYAPLLGLIIFNGTLQIVAAISNDQLTKSEASIYVFDQTVAAIEEAWEVIAEFECPEDFTG